MADQKSEEKRHAEMLEGLNKGIAEANGTMPDKEFVLIKRAKKALRKVKRQASNAIADLVPDTARKAQKQTSDREAQLLRDEQ
jgi:hypothetical protein